MDLRSGNIGLAVAVAMMAVGFAIVGADPTDTEMQLIYWPAFFAGIAVVLVVERRSERNRDRRSPR